MEEDDDDDDNDYDYIEDKLLSANTTAIGSTSGSSAAGTSNANAGAAGQGEQANAPANTGNSGGGKSQQNQALQNLLNGDSADKSVKKQRVWKKDMLRQDDFTKMKEMVVRLKKVRVNEAKTSTSGQDSGPGGTAGTASGPGTGKGGGKSIPARTSIQQTQGSNNLIKKEAGANRRSYLNK